MFIKGRQNNPSFRLYNSKTPFTVPILHPLTCRWQHRDVCCVDTRSSALQMNSDLCCATGQHLTQSNFSQLQCGFGLLMHITARGGFPLSSHHLKMSHYFGSSQGRCQAIWPMGLIAPREQGVCIQRTVTTEHTTLSSLNCEIMEQSCISISWLRYISIPQHLLASVMALE